MNELNEACLPCGVLLVQHQHPPSSPFVFIHKIIFMRNIIDFYEKESHKEYFLQAKRHYDLRHFPGEPSKPPLNH